MATLLGAAQIGKTTTVFGLLGWAACEQPGPAFWVMGDAEMAKETVRERVIPFLAEMPATAGLLPQARDDKSNVLLRLSTMKVFVRGSNSQRKLQSTPVRWLFLDEVRNYRKGALEFVLKRTRSYRSSKTIIITTPNNEDDTSHREWKNGTQSLLYWPCPHCGHWQPFRFGRDESPIYGAERFKGGFRWEESAKTRPEGKWHLAAIVPTIWYECEKCGGRISEADKYPLLDKVRRVDLNPRPLPGCVSVHTWAAYSVWVDWGKIVVEFLSAMDAAKGGDFQPLMAFVRETLGEPWKLRGVKADTGELKKRRGDFPRMSPLDDKKAARILTVDVQASAAILKYVYRQHFPGGSSRLLDYGVLTSFEELRGYQQTHRIKDRAVWLDTGHETTRCYRACLRFGWVATKGDRGEGYAIADPANKRTVVAPYKVREIDPFLGTTMAGKTTMNLVRFSSAAYKDRLYLFVIRGQGAKWEIFREIGEDYISELTSDEIHTEGGRRVWIERGTHDYGDCEILQLLAADVSKITASEVLEVETEKAEITS